MIKMKLVICTGKDTCGRKECGHAKPHEERGSCHAPYCDCGGIAAICVPIADGDG